MSEREAIVIALEALEAGDTWYAADVLLIALEQGGPQPQPEPLHACRSCGRRFEWPGLRDAHELRDDAFEAAA